MTLWINKCLALVLGLGIVFNTHTVSALTLEEEMVLAALTLNIVRFTTWPDHAQTAMKESLNLCVVGNNIVQQSFASIDNKAVGNKTLKIIKLSRMNNFDQCHVLYISDVKNNILLQIFISIKNSPLLTIGESIEFANMGGMVGLEKIDNKMTLNINIAAMKEASLNISSRLLRLANIIGTQ